LRSCTREVEVYSVRIDGFKVNLIDTPGFDDNKRSETEVLQTISAYLPKHTTTTFSSMELFTCIQLYKHAWGVAVFEAWVFLKNLSEVRI